MSDRFWIIIMICNAAINAGLYAQNLNAGAAVLCGLIAIDLIMKVRT